MSKKLLALRGLQGCGKSKFAAETLQRLGPDNCVIANKDSIRTSLFHGKWTRDNEKITVAIHDNILREGLRRGKTVISDNTNFGTHIKRLQDIANSEKAPFELEDFGDVPVEECIRRDANRLNSVGRQVIMDTYMKYLYKKPESYPVNPRLPDCGIVDIDGTIALMNGRSPYDWSKVDSDKPRWVVIDAVKGWQQQTGAKIVFLSGRDGSCYEATKEWLKDVAGFPDVFPLYMRSAGDQRKDSAIKQELVDAHIKGVYNIRVVFDDRRVMVAHWRSVGLGDVLMDVGDGTDY